MQRISLIKMGSDLNNSPPTWCFKQLRHFFTNYQRVEGCETSFW